MRPFWSGAISFGLVNIPIRLFPATRSHDVGFHLIHKADASPVRYQVMCEAEDKPISRDETVRGLDVGAGRIVMFEPEELEAIQERAAPHLVEILDFVDLKDVDPIYYQKAYYVGPQPGAARAYGLLRHAMLRTGKTAIARFGLRSKTHLAAVRPVGPALAIETMYYKDEVQPADAVPLLAEVEPSQREVELAELLIANLSRPWDPARYKDVTRERMEQLIERKLQGQVISTPAPPPETKVEELMAALERSLRGLEFEAAEPAGRGAANATTPGSAAGMAAEPAAKPARRPARRKKVE